LIVTNNKGKGRPVTCQGGRDWGRWSTPNPGRFTAGKQPYCPLHRRLGAPQGKSGRMRRREISFIPNTSQCLTTRNTKQDEIKYLHIKKQQLNKRLLQ